MTGAWDHEWSALLGTRLLPSRYAPGADGRFALGAAPTEFTVIICFSPLVGLPDSLVRKDQREFCPLSRGVISPKAQLLSIPLRNGIRFFPHPLPAPPSTCLKAYLPNGSDTGLPCSACPPEWVRSSLPAGDLLSTTGKSRVPVPIAHHFGPSLSASLACCE